MLLLLLLSFIISPFFTNFFCFFSHLSVYVVSSLLCFSIFYYIYFHPLVSLQLLFSSLFFAISPFPYYCLSRLGLILPTSFHFPWAFFPSSTSFYASLCFLLLFLPFLTHVVSLTVNCRYLSLFLLLSFSVCFFSDLFVPFSLFLPFIFLLLFLLLYLLLPTHCCFL